MTWNTFGHNHIKRILDLQAESGIFPHAYLFLGAEGLGKKKLALELANKILNTLKLENHPDFIMLDDPEITVEKLRAFMENLSFKPFLGKYKVAIVNNADNLNVQSQNAFLKTLEEPSASTVLILVSSRPLLKTIISRCQVMRFNRFSQRQMQEFLGAQFSEIQMQGAFGRPGKAINAPQDLEAQQAEWKKIKIMRTGEKLSALSAWAEKEPQDLQKLFETCFWTEVLSLQNEPKNFRAANLLLDAAENLKKNFNKKLVLQRLFLGL